MIISQDLIRQVRNGNYCSKDYKDILSKQMLEYNNLKRFDVAKELVDNNYFSIQYVCKFLNIDYNQMVKSQLLKKRLEIIKLWKDS